MDYSSLRYDLSLTVGQRVSDIYPEILDYVEFSDNYNDDRMRWVTLTVDDGSPFFKSHKDDFEDRSIAVYKHLKLNDKDLLAYITDRFKCDKQVRIDIDAMIFKYFVLIDKSNYNAWYTEWINFQELNAFLRIPINPMDDDYETKTQRKQAVSKFLPEKQKQLSAYERQIFGDSKIKQVVTNQVAKFMNWPEKMAQEQPTIDG